MIHFLLGMLGFAFAWILFYCGYHAGLKAAEPVVKEQEPPSEEEAAAIEAERDRLRAEQAAFHDLLGYNADVAYGRTTMSGKG